VIEAPPPRKEIITSSQVYWITRLDDIRDISFVLSVVSGTMIFLTILFYGINKSDGTFKSINSYRMMYFIFTPIAIVSVLILIFVPRTKEAAAIYIIPTVANSHFVQDTIPAEMKDVYGIAKGWLKDKLSVVPENKPEVKK
jgi:hypothetical protein